MNNKISNLRCLGGYTNKEGKKVKDNLLFRSGSLNINSKALEEALNSLKIKTIYDLRSSREVEKAPYVLPSNIKYKHYPVLNSLEGIFKNLNLDLSSSKEAAILISENHYMVRIYKEMALYPIMFGEIIKDIIKLNGEPILFHCAAGKDRTGVLATLLLLSLDVSQKDVMENYLLSLEYVKDYVESELDKLRKNNVSEKELNRIKDAMIVKEEYLNSFLSIVNEYPSFKDYAEEKLNLNYDDLEKLKTLFLE